MNAQQQKERCPVKIGQTYQGGKVIFILGDRKGWDIWTKHERIGTTPGLIDMPIHREEHHRLEPPNPEQRYQCQTCKHVMTESQLGVACAQQAGNTEYRLFCDNCGSPDLNWTD